MSRKTEQAPNLDTIAIHGGYSPDAEFGAVVEPLVLSTTFAQPAPGAAKRFEYSRSGNPTREILESRLAALEGGRYGLSLASGSAATWTMLSTLRPGDTIICGDDVYGGTYRLLERVARPFSVKATYVDLRDPASLRDQLTDQTKLVWFESPTNPLLKINDIEAICTIAHAHDLRVVVDNTFASPVLQRPLELGADVVLHSTTKYLNGHSDVVGGALIVNDPGLYEELKFLQNAIGAVPSPFDCYLQLRGIKTLPVRMARHSETALFLAHHLEGHPAVSRVIYPGLKSHPDHEAATRQMQMPGGMLAVELVGGSEAATRLLTGLKWFALAESLGAVESLAEHPASMTHASIPAELREHYGISDSLVRFSIGLESADDLWQDLACALDAL